MTSPFSTLKGEKISIDADSYSRPHEGGAAPGVAARFEVQRLLGQGGMGSVYVAQDRGLRRVVALKRLREGLEQNRGLLRRFMLEAQIGAQLEHPNIVPLYSFEHSEGGAPAITMQLLEGTTMAAYIAAAAAAPEEARSMRGEYALKERIGMLLGVCEAIHFAHERGVIHRDLKHDNVMLGRYREVYVMDWGLARVEGSPIDDATPEEPPVTDADSSGTTSVRFEDWTLQPPRATRQGDVIGTPQYMPPEQALGSIDSVGPASDQYSLAVMLQELATLRPARSHSSTSQAMKQAVANYLGPPVDVAGRGIHPALAAIVARATRKEPGERYPTVRALADDLRHFVRDEPVSVFDEGVARRIVRAAARRPALAMAVLSVCGFLASLLIIGAVVRDARQARELVNTQRMLIAVGSRAHELDVELSDLAADVKAVAAATVELLDRKPADFDHTPRPLPALSPHQAYGAAPVSFEGIVVTWPGKTPNAELPASAAKLARVEPWLRDTLVDALPSAEQRGSMAAQNAAFVAGRSGVLRAFVGLEDGSFAQFPAREVSADPRKRPWYAMASRDPALQWTRPVVDVAKKTLRISALLGVRSKGVLLGVAGCDLRVSALAKKLALDLPGFQRGYLVTEAGEIAVSEKLEASVLASITNPDEAVDLPRVDDRALAARIAGAERGGYVDAGDRLLVFAKLVSPPWTYVAELERARYLEH